MEQGDGDHGALLRVYLSDPDFPIFGEASAIANTGTSLRCELGRRMLDVG